MLEIPEAYSQSRTWIWGFHFKSLPKVWRQEIKPKAYFSDFLNLWVV